MASVVLLTHHAKATPTQFNDSLKSYVDSRTSLAENQPIIQGIDAAKIKQCVFGPNHVAFLMEDGRVCRASIIHTDFDTNIQLPKEESSDEDVTPSSNKKSVPTSNSDFSGASHTLTLPTGESLSFMSSAIARWPNQRVSVSSSAGTTSSLSTSTTLASRAITTRGRGRFIRAARGRNGSGWLSNRSVIPASSVPEDLISQAQIVLQGKSRNVIIRELQKTSLDVNLAVNNLLSRDDDDPDDGDDDYQEAYLPTDLISIFETTGIPNDEPYVLQRDMIFGDDYQVSNSYTRSTDYRSTNSNAQGESSSSARDGDHEESNLQSRDRWWGMLTNETKDKLVSTTKNNISRSKRNEINTPSKTSLAFGDVVWWRFKEESEDSIKFSYITSLHSELLAITENGFLHYWKWNDKTSPITEIKGHCYHRAEDLNLTDEEKIVKIAACNVRASIVTESGKIATWLDGTLSAVGNKLEHPLQIFAEFKNITVTKLEVCEQYSCVQLLNGTLFWWGVFPFEQRKKILDKVKAKAKKSAITGSGYIKPDMQVCIRSCPLYYPGAVGFTTVNGKPQVGELQEQAWTISEKCRFRIIDGRKMKTEIPKSNQEHSTDDKVDSEAGTNLNEAISAGSKRKIELSSSEQLDTDDNPYIEEEWCLRDVIFVEEVRNVPIGRVLKVDGAYALVHFSPQVITSQSLLSDNGNVNVKNLLSESRLLRKDELQIVKWTTPPKMPECFQKTPKALHSSSSSRILAFTLNKNGVHAVTRSSNVLRSTIFSLASGRPSPGGNIQPEPSSFLGKGNSLSLYCSDNGSLSFVQDPNGCVYPFIKDNLGGIQNPNLTNILPARAIAIKQQYYPQKFENSLRMSLVLMVLKENKIVKHVLSMDSEFLLHELKTLEGNEDGINEIATIKCDGNRNLLHICVSTCKPVTPKQAKLINTMKTLGIACAEKNEETKDGFDSVLWEPIYDGLTCLDILLNNCVLSKYVKQLLCEKDAFGCTPFMSAALVKAYPAASKLYSAAVKCATNENGVLDKEVFMTMICPTGSDPNLSPLQVLCYNDTCSFTWTGTRHINQDIFECKTCGLIGPLCCCTECAQVCHIGHECKLKHTSPTAYCDCWQKCPCKSLVGGDQTERATLFHKLVEETELSAKPNKKGQHILLFLALTVARQSNEQTQYVPNRIPANSESKSRNGSGIRAGKNNRCQSPPIDHELEPPQFAKMALAYMLKNWVAVKSAVLFGEKQNNSQRVLSLDENLMNISLLQPDDMIKQLDSQTGTLHLDNFIHKLITKCNSEFLDALIQTLCSRLNQTKEKMDKNKSDHDEAILVAKRVIHSVIRVFSILSACTSPAKRKLVLPSISRCKRVFLALNFIAVPEMALVASAILAPVRMGIPYPTSTFTLGSSSDSISACDEFFSMNPMPSRIPNMTSSSTQYQHPRVRFADNSSLEIETNEDMETDAVSDNQTQSTSDSQAFGSQANEADEGMDLMGESESDSDESTQADVTLPGSNVGNDMSSSIQRRNHGGDAYFTGQENSETEGDEDDGMEEEEEDDDEEDDDDDDESNAGNASEQRTTTTSRDNPTPHALQWAFRNTSNSLTASTNSTMSGSGSSSVLYAESSQIRRSGGAASAEGASSNTTYSTPSALARTFSIIVTELSDILSSARDMNMSGNRKKQVMEAKDQTDIHLKTTWRWLWHVMEVTETQLKFGASILAVSDPNHPQHPLFDATSQNNKTAKPNQRNGNNFSSSVRSINENRRKKRAVANQSSSSDANNGRQDYLTYLLSLMRSQDSEHGDSLPKIDVAALRHVAFVLDAFIYYLRTTQDMNCTEDEETSSTPSSLSSYEMVDSNRMLSSEFRVSSSLTSSLLKSDVEDEDEGEITDEQDNMEEHSAVDAKILRQTFFKRSDSTLVLGHEPADPFNTTFREALPLADRPQLLTPISRRDQLFGTTKSETNDASLDPCFSLNLNSGGEQKNLDFAKLSPNTFLGRWNMCLELFGLVFLDDVGAEQHSVLNELGRFDVKEAKFKRDMEKIKIGHQKDLFLEGLDRDRNILLQQTLRQLNAQFGRRLPGAGPLSIHLLKVSFKDELGEGLGVVRSFFTAIGNAFLSDEKLPNLENIFMGSRGLTHQLRARAKERERERRRITTSNLSVGLIPRVVRRNERSSSERTAAELDNCVLSLDASSYTPPSGDNDEAEEEYVNGPIPHHKREMARRIYRRVNNAWPEHASKITGMLLELTPSQLVYLLTHDAPLKDKMNEAAEMIISSYSESLNSLQHSASSSSNSQQKNSSNSSSLDTNKRELSLTEDDEADNTPLFYQPGKPGYYSPVPGKCSPERLNCFRNVGRVVGLCFLMNDISPMSFNRHVIKYLLGRRVHWHDLAFFDPTLYESLRQLIVDANRSDHQEIFNSLGLNYSIQLRPEEGGSVVDLVSGGSQMEVAADNVHDYVKRYAEYRMIGNARRALQAMRRGLLDVVPSYHLDGLTAEDFRLLLNGAGDINIRQLMSYTAYTNETGGEDPEKINKFKKWFVSMLENMTTRQKQDLLYFWTASPAMPASAEGYQPLPSIMLKPANDHQLPTANTCISRLYVPLYSSKSILRSKFLMAIKTKIFGFI